MASTTESVRIRYRRPPDREELYDQLVLARTDTCAVTLLEAVELVEPLVIGGKIVLEPGAPIVWFTFAGAWHDIGRFHTAAGVFTGLYVNILTPILDTNASDWQTTDLFLDLWLQSGSVSIEDIDELARAEAEGWLDHERARRARDEATNILLGATAGAWPPDIVHEWTLQEAERFLGRL